MIIKEIKENKYVIFDQPFKLTIKNFIKLMLWKLLSFYYFFLLRIFHPNYVRKKYEVSICALFRDESPYLKEWIEYHRVVGVEHFYLYNNFSRDNYKMVLKPYIEEGIVTLVDWPYPKAQMEAYSDCVKNYSNETNWIGFIDLDEFVVPNKVNSINIILNKFKNRPTVIFQWKYFGSSGFIQRDLNSPVIEDFTVSWKKYSDIGKLFFNTEYDYYPESKQYMHVRWSKYRGIKLPSVNIFDRPVFWGFNSVRTDDLDIQINHYVVKSYNEFVEKKCKRLGGVTIYDKSQFKEYFYFHEDLCQGTDHHIFKYVIKTKLALNVDSSDEKN